MNYQDEFDKLIESIKNSKDTSDTNETAPESPSHSVGGQSNTSTTHSRARQVDEDASYDEFRAQYFGESDPAGKSSPREQKNEAVKQASASNAGTSSHDQEKGTDAAHAPIQQKNTAEESAAKESPKRGKADGEGSPARRSGKKTTGFFAAIRDGWNRMNNRVKVITYVGSVLVVSLLLSIYLLGASSDYFGLNQEDRNVEIEVPEGATLSDVTRLLQENDIINHSAVFSLYAGLKGAGGNIQSGYYTFNCNMSYSQIIQALRYGYVELEVVNNVTFTEGMTVLDIANVLEENRVCTSESFLEALNTEEFGYDFVDSIPASDTRYLKLEGYLFPDTYDFYVNENPVSVINRFLNNFNSKVTAEMRTQAENLGLTLDQVITLASVIQAEAADSDQMYAISGIFHNRLNSDSLTMLQSDATRDYATNNISPFITDNQAMLDAYNTYVCNGLPAGPICNPGLDAIRAALQPENNNYYYFVHDSEGNVYYASTYAEHLQNVERARSVGDGTVGGTATDE